jgi:hypothetical protein
MVMEIMKEKIYIRTAHKYIFVKVTIKIVIEQMFQLL